MTRSRSPHRGRALSRLQAGAPGLFARFEAGFESAQHSARLETRLSFLWNCLRNDADAEELTQAVFVTAYGALKNYRPTHPFVAWLLTIARHRVIDHCRSAARRESTVDAPSRLVDERDPASILAEREDQEETWASVRRLLPPDQFQAVYLRYGEDLSVREIARVLGRTSTSVKVLLFRARRTLVAAWSRHAVRPPLGNSNSRLRPSRPVPAPQPQFPLRAR